MENKYTIPIDLELILDEKDNKTLFLNDLLLFPHGMDGFHIWEAGIVLSRYVIYNPELFN